MASATVQPPVSRPLALHQFLELAPLHHALPLPREAALHLELDEAIMRPAITRRLCATNVADLITLPVTAKLKQSSVMHAVVKVTSRETALRQMVETCKLVGRSATNVARLVTSSESAHRTLSTEKLPRPPRMLSLIHI